MKKNLPFFAIFFVALAFKLPANTEPAHSKWISKNPFEQKVFVENKGQFEANTGIKEEIFYQAKSEGVTSYFTRKGVFYRRDEVITDKKHDFKERESEKEREREREERGFEIKHHELDIQWIGGNPSVEITAEEKVSFYYTYSFDPKTQKEGIKADAFKKIIYKNLYPFIDVEYTFPEDKGGIKYSVILHPGANPGDIKMKWNGKNISSDETGDLVIKSSFGDFIDHAPKTFFEDGTPIESAFVLNGKTVSFKLSTGTSFNQTIIIDPWTSSPTFTTNKAYDLNYDFAGNVYAYGSENTYQLAKFNSAGTLLWIYGAVIVSSGYTPPYYGDFAVDGVSGTSYLGEGFNTNGARIEKVNSSGIAVGSYPGYANMREIWRMDYNYCNGTVIIAGGGTSSPSYQSFLLDTNLVNITPVQVVSTNPDIDAALLSTDKYSNTAFMLFANGPYAAYNNYLVRCPMPALTPPMWGVLTPHTFQEVFSVTYVGSGMGMTNGFNGMAVSPTYAYSYDGSIVRRWDKATGAAVSSFNVSGTMFSWGGLDVDECDNVYVGVQNAINVYDINWNLVTTYPTSGTIYDLRLSSTKLYACGDGFVSEFDLTTSPTTLSSLPASCSACNGSATVNASTCSGSTGFTYLWQPGGQTTQTATNLCPGNYTVTVYSNCSVAFRDTVTVKTSNGVTAAFTYTNVCLGVPASFADNSSTAGGAIASWNWNFGDGATSTTQNPTHTYSTAGNYSVTLIAATAGGACLDTVLNVITVAGPPTPNFNATAVCLGNPTVFTDATTGTAPTAWAWNFGDGNTSAIQNPTNTYTASGVYNVTLTATSAGGCPSTTVIPVSVNAPFALTVNSGTICIGGSTTLTAVSPAVTYTWNTGVGLNTTNGATVSASPGVTTVYTVTGTDINSCSSTGTSTVTVNPLPTPTATNNSPLCENQALNLSSGGGVSYSWTGPNGFSSAVSNPTANPVTLAGAGVYSVTATDANNCQAIATTTVVVNPLPVVSATGTTVCANATINLSSSGGVSYLWSGPLAYSSISQNPSIANSTTGMSGTYSVTVTDANGCVNGNSTSVTVNPLPVVTASSNAPCAGTTLNLSSTGGTSWSWTGPSAFSSSLQNPGIANAAVSMNGVYTVNVLDANSCAGSATVSITVNPLPTVTVNSGTICIGQQTATLTASGASSYAWSPSTGLSSTIGGSVTATPGSTTNYIVTGTDANGCVSTANSTVTVNPLPLVSATGTTVCTPATINLTSSGGVSYAWTGPLGFSTNNQNPSIANSTTGMSGTYSVTVTDANGCVNGNSTSVTVNPLPVVTASSNTPCVGATLNLSSTGGTSWSWTGPSAFSSVQQNPSIANAAVSMNGIYTVNVLDANSCAGSATVSITVNPLPTVTVNSGTICVTQQTATLTASGSSISYVWSPSTGLSSSTGSSVSANPGATTNYVIAGTDINGCINTGTASVLVNPLPVVTVTGSTVCVNSNANLTASGGISYSWSGPNGFISNTQNPVITNAILLDAGSYAVTVTDANGCVNGNVATIVVNPPPDVTASAVTICTGSQGTLIAGGASTYAWSPTTGLVSANSGTVSTNATSTTNYTVTGTDINGCVNTATTTVTVNPLPVLAINPPITSGCAPVCVSFANTTTVTGTCAWSFGDGTSSLSCNPTHCFSGQGTFGAILSLTDNNGCVNTATASVVVYPTPVADFNATPQPTSIYEPHIYFTDASAGAVVNTWSWTLGDPNNTTATIPNPNITYLAPGSYPVHLLVTTALGCKDSTTKIIVIADEYAIYVPNAFSPNADGVNDLFFAKGEGIKDFKLYVYDRWGNQVFYSDDIYKGWDGRYQSRGTEIVQEDVYVWKIECKTVAGERKMMRGTVSLIK